MASIGIRFNPCFDGSVARGLQDLCCAGRQWLGFNPCFDGSVARGSLRHRMMRCANTMGFNPCFDGSVARG